MSLLSWLQKSAAANGSRESLASSSRQSLRQGDMIASETASSTEQNGSEHTLTPESPNQPVLTFPQRMFGNQQRAFCSSWYSKYPWLHYQVGTDSAPCIYIIVIVLFTCSCFHFKTMVHRLIHVSDLNFRITY